MITRKKLEKILILETRINKKLKLTLNDKKHPFIIASNAKIELLQKLLKSIEN